ncbi:MULTISPECIES: phage tail protein [unclassified Bradyrhizobium]
MPLETASTINDFVLSNPAHSDGLNQADAHLRLIKSVLKNTFPGLAAPLMNAAGQIVQPKDGTGSAPAYTFASEPTLGFYRSAAGVISIAGGQLKGASPVGSVHTFLAEPSGLGKGGTGTGHAFLELDGSTWNTADFPALAAQLGVPGSTFTLPNMTTTGRFPRSRRSGVAAGAVEANAVQQHTHSVVGSTGTETAAHNHTFSGTTGSMNRNNPHTHSSNANVTGVAGVTGGGSFATPTTGAATINAADINHEHAFSGTTSTEQQAHAHNIAFESSGVNGATAVSETRPEALSFVFCIKT